MRLDGWGTQAILEATFRAPILSGSQKVRKSSSTDDSYSIVVIIIVITLIDKVHKATAGRRYGWGAD